MNRPLDPLLRLSYFVAGTPVPQGSKRAWYNQATKQVMMTEDAGARHSSWRWELSSQARQAMADAGYVQPFDQAILCAVVFHQHRPAVHYGSGKYSQRVKPSAPRHPGRKPDLDKLVRAVFDSLTPAAVVLGVIAAVNSVIALFYYANVAKEAWMAPVPDGDRLPVRVPSSLGAAIGLCAIATVAVGVLPQIVGRFGELATFALGG